MSLILEALKKSEAKRRLGEAPDIGTPFALKRRRRSPLPLVAIAILIVGALGWWFLRPPEQSPPATATAPQPSGQFANVDPGTAAAPQPVRATPRPAGDRISRLPIAPKPASPPAPAPLPPNGAAAVPAAAPAVAAPTPPPAAPPAKPAVVAPVNVTADAPTPQHAGLKPFPPPEPTEAETKANEEAKAKAAAAEKSASPPVPMYYELAYNLRKDLPAMSISMHVYAADPTQRFVIINGDRFIEGDTVKDDLTLREIQPDGLLMEFRGQRFFYPRTTR